MKQPAEDPRSLETRRALVRELGEALRPLHRLLIEVARHEYERERGPIGGPVVLHRLLIEDPFFAWLYPLLQRMAHLDELEDDEEQLAAKDLATLRRETELFLFGVEGRDDDESQEGEAEPPVRTGFAARYVELLQARPEVVMAHVSVRRALDSL